MNTYERIKRARAILHIEEKASIIEIRESYLWLLKRWHPDPATSSGEIKECEKRTRDIIWAYKVLMEYCQSYKISFSKEEVEKYLTDEEWWEKRFGGEPLWHQG